MLNDVPLVERFKIYACTHCGTEVTIDMPRVAQLAFEPTDPGPPGIQLCHRCLAALPELISR